VYGSSDTKVGHDGWVLRGEASLLNETNHRSLNTQCPGIVMKTIRPMRDDRPHEPGESSLRSRASSDSVPSPDPF
jgi:hypothetical protein